MEVGTPKNRSSQRRYLRWENWQIPTSTLAKIPYPGEIVGVEEDEKDMSGKSHIAIVWRFSDFSGPRIAYFDIFTGEYLGDGFVEDEEEFFHEQFDGISIE